MSKYVSLISVCDFQGGSQPPKDEWSPQCLDNYVRMLQIRDFTKSRATNDEYVKFSENLKLCESNDVLIARYGASIGKILTGMSGAYNVAMIKTIPNEEKLTKKYLKYYLHAEYFQKYINHVGTRAAQAGFNKLDLVNLEIPLPPLDKQNKISDELDKISNLITKRKTQIEKLDLIVKAKFVEVFGDPVTYPMGWAEHPLSEMAAVVSGITKGRKTKDFSLVEVPYMAVSNVKDGYIDWTTVKTILATEKEINHYRLFPQDILMTEGGDPDKLGRGAVIKKPPENCIHQNHIFRVRVRRETLEPIYFAEYLKHQKAKRYFLWSAKQTTGIASINMGQLKRLSVIIPPILLQNQFADYVQKVEQTKTKMEQCLAQLEVLYKQRMQAYFE